MLSSAEGSHLWYFIVLFICIVLHCIALHCIALHCIVLHCIALHCIALHCIALYCIVLYCIVLYCIALYCIESILQIYSKGNDSYNHFYNAAVFHGNQLLVTIYCVLSVTWPYLVGGRGPLACWPWLLDEEWPFKPNAFLRERLKLRLWIPPPSAEERPANDTCLLAPCSVL